MDIEFRQDVIPVDEAEQLVCGPTVQLSSFIRVDMRKYQVNILLLKVIKRFAFWQNTPNQFVGYFDAAFLIRGTGIAIENKTAKLIVFILFDGDRIAELTATVSQNDRKESTIMYTE